MLRVLAHLLVLVVLYAATGPGVLAWLVGLVLGRRWLSVPLAYAAIWGAAQITAPLLGLTALPCSGAPLRMQSSVYCLAMRNFVAVDLAVIAQDVARQVEAEFPGTITLALDGNLPLPAGFPMIPHLSHDDGRKLDFALYYQDGKGYVAGHTRSPLGYFAFESSGADCPETALSLRWDLDWLQGNWPDWSVEPLRTRALIGALVAEDRIARVLIEPTLAADLGVAGPKLRFQGCRAARHDDHIHVQIAR